jgi:hypothetical protein
LYSKEIKPYVHINTRVYLVYPHYISTDFYAVQYEGNITGLQPILLAFVAPATSLQVNICVATESKLRFVQVFSLL